MIVSGLLFPAPQRATGASPSVQATEPAASFAPTEELDVEPTYFRAISSISYGSLASAYHAMKAQEAASPRGAGNVQPLAILSGSGIPSAMAAYNEVISTGPN